MCACALLFLIATCPLLEAPPNGRKLGKALGVGHEVHFLCEPGYELLGTESRLCMESLSWSGQPALCRSECRSCPPHLSAPPSPFKSFFFALSSLSSLYLLPFYFISVSSLPSSSFCFVALNLHITCIFHAKTAYLHPNSIF